MTVRIDGMLTRPQMYGSTTESVELQVLLLIELLLLLDKQIPTNDTFTVYKKFIHKEVPDIGCTTLSGYFGDAAFTEVVAILKKFYAHVV